MAADVVALGAALVATRIAGRPGHHGPAHLRLLPGRGLRLGPRGAAHARRRRLHRGRGAVGRIGDEPEVASSADARRRHRSAWSSTSWRWCCCAAAPTRASTSRAPTSRSSPTPSARSACIVAALLVAATGHGVWDTVVALAIAVFVAVRAVVLGREVLAVLGQHVPDGHGGRRRSRRTSARWPVSPTCTTCTSGRSRRGCTSPPRTSWRTRGTPSGCSTRRASLLRREHAISHATLQVESAASRECHELDW